MSMRTDTEWLQAYLHHELSTEEILVLEKRLCLEDRLAQLLVELASDEVVLSEWADLKEAGEWRFFNGTDPSDRKFVRFLSSKRVITPAIILFLLVAWSAIFYSGYRVVTDISSSPKANITRIDSHPPLIKEVAIVKATSEGELRSQGILFVVNDRLQTGQQYHLEKGLLELHMDSGAEVLISGPTSFQLLGSNSLRLLQGTMTADVPRKANGFEVRTPTMKIIDLGTRFGVFVNKEGISETHVFEGVVNYFSAQQGGTYSLPGRLTAGESVKRQADGKVVQRKTKNDTLFALCLHRQAGIKKLTGDLKFVPKMPASLAGGDFTSDTHIQVFLERRNFILPEEIQCSVVDDSENNQEQLRTKVIKKGTKVSVYYFHFDDHRIEHPEYSERLKSLNLKGNIYFNKKILGILPGNKQLLQTDQSLGVSGSQYVSKKNQSAGKEKGRFSPSRSADDSIKFFPDRQSVHLDWRLGRNDFTGGIDAMRVIVAEE